MGAIVKILIAAVVLNAAVQAGLATFRNYQYEDAVHEAMLFSPNASDDDIISQAQAIASEQGLEISPEAIQVTRRGADVIFQAAYDTNVPLVPGVYRYTWHFEPTATVRSLRAIPVPRP